MSTNMEQDYGTPQRTGTATERPEGRIYSIVGFVLAGISLFIVPPLFGIAGAIVGYVGYRKGDELGKWAAGASIAALVVGMILGFVVVTTAG